ncbi:DUF1473 family protein [Borrelia crocidurae]|uniref:Uncharacterized protein n=1 Tax=Borrelia crocidurae (strain Achema) TaxID=1155096 RepID=I0FDW5_BORCA|nr:DUF1473 family protein [Borrelia crocidurae]AFI31671.1 Protein of unknown function (DUF1473)-containing protein [Borrelia crocidurae str. Achema]
MIMRYKMNILSKNKTYTFDLKVLPVYQWDSILGFSQNHGIDKLNDINYLKKITDLMIKPDFLTEFYKILDKNREYVSIYKEYLVGIIYSIQFNIFHRDSDFQKPSLIYLSEYEDTSGDFTKFTYINELWNYEYLTKEENE